MHGRALLPVLVWTLFAVAGSPSHAEQTTQLQRLNVGDFRAYFTANAPGSLQYRTTPLIEGAYFYTAVKTGAGNMIEGFNFSRNEDGLLQFGREKIEGGYRLTWKNKRWIYDPPTRKTDRLAGEATVTLTLTAVECSLRYQGKIEPNVGFGEIGFFLSEEGLTKAGPAAYTATLANEQEHGGTFPLAAEQKGNLFSGLAALKVSGVAVTHDFHLSGQAFPGSHGVVFQDYRKQDRAPGCYRVVLSFDTTAGNEFDYTWRLWVEPKAGASPVGASARDAQLLTAPLAKMPEARATLGDAQAMPSIRHGDRSGDVGLQVAVTEQGQFLVSDGEQQVVGDDYFQVFAAGVPKRQETVSGDVRRISLRYDSPTGQLTKEAFVSPDEVWLAWTVKAKVEGRGEVGFYCPAAAFRAPFISYRAINQSTVAETDKLELSSTYCLLSGGAKDTREFQCGTSRRPDWVLQDFTDRGNRYRFVATPSLKAGEEWRAVFRFVRKPVEPYPAVSFDQAREERGIVSTLLTDALEGGFTVVPARSAKYTFTDQPLLVRLKYYAVDRRDRTVDLSCRLIDTWGREVATRDYRLASGGERFAAVELPVTVQTNGAYRMEIAYRCGEVAGTRELTFTALPTVPDTGSRPGSVFGAALGYGDFLGTLAKRIGLKWNRCHCAIGDTQCGLVQPERGQYAWEGIDEACDFHQQYQLLGCHSVSEGWLAPWLSTMWKERPFEEYLDAFVNDYVKPLARQYKGRINCWEVTNEPYYQYKDCPEKWVQLMKATYEALKEVDPDCTVVGTCGPPGSMGYSWYRRTFALGALNYQDAVSSHLYHFGPWVGSGVALTVRKWMHEIRAIMQENGKVLPLWNSETTVSPPATMYRHPSHTRYVQYHPGEAPTDPLEQSQTYFKVLVVHKAEDVKYSFHIFHGGVEYTSHTGEYDETPLAFLATQAALAKYLEEADYLEDLKLHDDVQCFLFRSGKRLILIPWGPMFLKHDCAVVSLLLPADRFTARDVFDNPLPVESSNGEMRLTVTWEGFFLLTDSLSVDELKAAVGKARVSVHFAEEGGGAVRGQFVGEGAGPAKRSDWVGCHAVDLAAVANRSFTDETPADGKGGWTDEGENDMRFLPSGDWVANGVPFHLLDSAKNDGKSCLILRGGMNPNVPFPERVPIPVGQRLSRLHFLHTSTWGTTSGDAFRYVLHYKDGFTEEVPVVMGRNCADWWWLGSLPDALTAWEGPNPVREKVRLYQMTYETNHPKGAQAVLESLEVVSACHRPIPVVVAITGVYSN